MDRDQSIEIILNIIKYEITHGYKNNAVFGGLDGLTNNWINKARNHGLPEELIIQVTGFLSKYPNSSTLQRQSLIKDLLNKFEPNLLDFTNKDRLLSDFMNQSVIEIPSQVENYQSRPSVQSRNFAGKANTNSHNFRSSINAPLSVIDRVGKATADKLGKLGLFTLEDILYFFPRRYEDYSQLKPIHQLSFGDELSIVAKFYNIYTKVSKHRKGVVEAAINDGTGFLRVNWYKGKYADHFIKSIKPDFLYVFSGKIDVFRGRLILLNPEIEEIDKEHLQTNRIVPVYPLTAGITQKKIREITNKTVVFWATRVTDFLPESLN